ncbi:MAG TPA: hypothetical protein VFJ16_08920 [Longimicrobium sp.]|nr:hypothetical protein [Longimicrobium sp.]
MTFTSIFSGATRGRWPHIHFEVYPSVSAATTVSNKVATSQIALPKAACDTVFAQGGYTGSVSNLSQISLATYGIQLGAGDRHWQRIRRLHGYADRTTG